MALTTFVSFTIIICTVFSEMAALDMKGPHEVKKNTDLKMCCNYDKISQVYRNFSVTFAFIECFNTFCSYTPLYEYTPSREISVANSRRRVVRIDTFLDPRTQMCFQLMAVQIADEGYYTCAIEYGLIRDVSGSIILINDEVTNPSPEASIVPDVAAVGETVTLKCKRNGEEPPGVMTTYAWYKEGNSSFYFRSAQNEVKIQVTDVKDAGTFICRTPSSAAGPLSKATLAVKAGILIMEQPSKDQAIRTNPFNTKPAMSCVVSTMDDVAITWSKNGKPLPASEQWTEQSAIVEGNFSQGMHRGMRSTLVWAGSTLTCSDVNKMDGVYRCHATVKDGSNKEPIVSPKMTVAVEYPAHLLETTQTNIVAKPNSSVHLRCDVCAMPPPVAYQWTYNGGHPLPADSVFVLPEGKALIITFANPEITGSYSCHVLSRPFGETQVVEFPFSVVLASDTDFDRSSLGWIIGLAVAMVTVAILVVVVVLKRKRLKTWMTTINSYISSKGPEWEQGVYEDPTLHMCAPPYTRDKGKGDPNVYEHPQKIDQSEDEHQYSGISKDKVRPKPPTRKGRVGKLAAAEKHIDSYYECVDVDAQEFSPELPARDAKKGFPPKPAVEKKPIFPPKSSKHDAKKLLIPPKPLMDKQPVSLPLKPLNHDEKEVLLPKPPNQDEKKVIFPLKSTDIDKKTMIPENLADSEGKKVLFPLKPIKVDLKTTVPSKSMEGEEKKVANLARLYEK